MAAVPDAAVQLLLGIFQARRKQLARRQQFDLLHQIRHLAGIRDHHFQRLFPAQIAEFFQHLVGGLEINGQGLVGVREFLAGQQDMAVHLILRLLKMHVAGGADGLVQLLAQLDDGAVEVPQFLFGSHIPIAQHEHIIADGLDLQIIVKRGDPPQFRPVLVIRHRPEELAGFAGRADEQPLPVRHQFRLGNDGHPLEILQVGGGDQLIQVLETHLVLGDDDDMLGETVGFAALGTQLQHLPVDLLQQM